MPAVGIQNQLVEFLVSLCFSSAENVCAATKVSNSMFFFVRYISHSLLIGSFGCRGGHSNDHYNVCLCVCAFVSVCVKALVSKTFGCKSVCV